jgi:glutaredoxin
MTGCSYCNAAEILLNANKIPFEKKMLDQDFTREWIREQYPTAGSFPIVVVDGYYIGGYVQLKEELKKQSDPRSFLSE